MEHLGELLSLFVAVLWTATALFADVASHRLGAMTVNIIRLTLATVFIAITLMFTIGAPILCMPDGRPGYGWGFRLWWVTHSEISAFSTPIW